MPVIKRYANRKLYDTETKRYVTLEDLANFVRRGEDVRVVDHATGEDLTSVTLLQVVFEEEKKIGGLLPQVFLTRLIRAGGSKMSALRGRLVALDPFQTVDEEIRRRMLSLVERGLVGEDEAERLLSLLVNLATPPGAVHIAVRGEEEPEAEMGQAPESAAAEPSPADDLADPLEVEALQRQVMALEEEMERLKQAAERPAARPE
jgi:polyhydroxyalkanoate synthesis repressor PhaR